MWDGEKLEGGGGGVGGLSADRRRVIVPEDMELTWMSVGQNAGHHDPGRTDRKREMEKGRLRCWYRRRFIQL